MSPMKRPFLLLLVTINALMPLSSQENSLDLGREELESTSSADITFESYSGPEDRIDSAEAIRSIGYILADGVTSSGVGLYTDKYRAQRAIGDPLERGFGADIVEILPEGRVDHITNLRRILSGYLERAWGYSRDDADLLSRFITVYNAVYRGAIEVFADRYRADTLSLLDGGKLGLALGYREWPGKTQLVIPVKDNRYPGDLDAVEPTQLIDTAVVARLRERQDLGISDRKAIIEFIERVVEERTAQIVEERAQIAEEQVQIEERRQDIEEEIAQLIEDIPERTATETTPTTTTATTIETPVTEPPAAEEPVIDTPQEEPPTEPTERVAELQDEQEQLDERSAELEQRSEELDQEEEAVEQLTEQVQELYQETAEDQETLIESPPEVTAIPMVIYRNGFELILINAVTMEPMGDQTVQLEGRSKLVLGDSLYAVHATSRHLLRIDTGTLEVLSESVVVVAPEAPIMQVGEVILTIIEDGDAYYVGQFDGTAALRSRSSKAVAPGTDLVVYDSMLIVQLPDRTFSKLDLRDF